MATSSITHNFVIKGDAVERFANALEVSFNTEVPKRPPCGRQLTDPEEIREFMDKVRKRYGANDNAQYWRGFYRAASIFSTGWSMRSLRRRGR